MCVVIKDLKNINLKYQLKSEMADYWLDIRSMHWPDEDVKADTNKLFWCQKNILVVSRQVLLQVFAPFTLICCATRSHQLISNE